MRMFKKPVQQGRRRRKHRRRSLSATLRMLSRGERRWRVFSTSSLFAATRHVVDQGPINIGATEADGIEEEIGVCYKVLLVGEFIGDDLAVAGLAEHHQPPRHAYGFSSRAPSHDVLH